MAGPCAVEDAAQIGDAAAAVASAGCPVLRGGAFKPRTSPYSFQGLGAEGVRLLLDAAGGRGLAAVSEVLEPADLPALEGVALLQVGARNMQNFPLLSLAAAAAGADGLLVEVHPRPAEALSDGAQALLPPDLNELMARLPPLLEAVGRELWRPAPLRRAVAR